MWKLIIPFLCSAISFPLMPFERKEKNGFYGPIPPTEEKLEFELPNEERGELGTWFHNMKNISTEYVRADSQYWSKLLAFIILIQFIIIIL